MTVVDTSVWIGYLRGSEETAGLRKLLEDAEVLLHPWVLGELVLGNLGRKRRALADDLRRVPAAPVVSDDDIFHFIEARDVAGSGLGWVDVNVLASTLLANSELWSLDGPLNDLGATLGIPIRRVG